MNRTRRTFRCVLLLAVAALAGCHSPSKTRPKLSAYRFEAPQAPKALPEPGQLDPLKAATQPYRVTEGDGADSVVEIVIKRDKKDGDFPIRRVLPDQRIEHLAVAADGSIVVGAVDDLSHNVITYYDPPLPVIPVGLKDDEPMTFTSDMKVVPISRPDVVQDSGKVTKTISHDADQVVVSPAGRFKARRIHSTYTAALKTARVTSTSDEWYVPKKGLIAEQESETVSALILHWTHKHTWVIDEK